jgi:hypothetical protein
MISEHRPISRDEADVVRATLENAAVEVVSLTVLESLPSLRVVSRCACGCASIDFEAMISVAAPSKRLGDGIGMTASGDQVGVIVWGNAQNILGLEVYELGVDRANLCLPVATSIVPFDRCASH